MDVVLNPNGKRGSPRSFSLRAAAPTLSGRGGASCQGPPEVRATAPVPHHEAQVSSRGRDVASELVVEVHVLIDKPHVLFVWQTLRAQTASQQEEPKPTEPQLQNASWRPQERLDVTRKGADPWGLHCPPAAGRSVRTRRPAPVTCQSTGQRREARLCLSERRGKPEGQPGLPRGKRLS